MADSNRPGLFIVTASDAAARRHVAKTIERPVEVEVLNEFAQPGELAMWVAGGYGSYAWGAVPGVNTQKWDAMEKGDYVVFYQGGEFTFVARVLAKTRNENLAERLWGRADDGRTWELMFFLSQPSSVSKRRDELADYLQSTPYMGFTRVGPRWMEKIIEDYGTIDAFVSARFIYANRDLRHMAVACL